MVCGPSSVSMPADDSSHRSEADATGGVPLRGDAHRTETPAESLAIELPEALAAPDDRRLHWTFFLSVGRPPGRVDRGEPGAPGEPDEPGEPGDRYAIWLNETLVYHHEIAPPHWMPAVRHFVSRPLNEGDHVVRVRNMTTGDAQRHAFSADATRHIVIFDRPTQPLTIRTFPHHVQYR